MSLQSVDLSGSDPSDLMILVVFRPGRASVQQRQVLATVAHDLKNPLSAIFGYVDALLDTSLGAGVTDNQRAVIGRVRSTAARALEMVRNYQYFAELSEHAVIASAAREELSTTVRVVLDYTWRSDAHTPRLELKLAQEGLWVKIERVQLERIISNLLSNALKYTPANGVVTVTTAVSDGRALLEVTNTGALIHPDELPMIFDKFQRTSTSRGKPGSGLGLHICKQLVEAAGGEITAESNTDLGTRFQILLPRTTEA
jgi:signal transduction histidine kinase